MHHHDLIRSWWLPRKPLTPLYNIHSPCLDGDDAIAAIKTAENRSMADENRERLKRYRQSSRSTLLHLRGAS
ncbi:hypothetical protein A0H81_02353 [Grifola frondosa]|uniref:Uncharacterized protein n=1 Tax=Grifola frondosa TaxID=5627 RepID=A0A1C7MLX7_GRIFR|nr:hypothetical protein A0H81_02353 [Grifola frondosa]